MAEVSAEARLRGFVYRFLSLGFHFAPREEDVTLATAAARSALEAGRVELADGLSRLVALARETPAEALAQEFNDLFMVPMKKYVAPYESVYRDTPLVVNDKSSPRTCGPSTQQVAVFYERVGLAISKEYVELPDYAGLELACMEYLCDREAGYLEAGDVPAATKARRFQEAFLRDHLAQWLLPLVERIGQRAETDYYRSFASLIGAWVRQEEAALPCASA